MMRFLAELSSSVIMRENYKESHLNKIWMKRGLWENTEVWECFFKNFFGGRGLGDDAWWIKCLVCKWEDQSWSLAQNLGQMWLPVIPAERSSMQAGYRLGNKHAPCVGEAALVKWREWRAWCRLLSSSRVHTGLLLKCRNAHTQLSAKNTFILLEVKH